jgi:hypothetical protein
LVADRTDVGSPYRVFDGPVPNRVEMRKAHSSGGRRTTTESPPGRAVGGMRRGQAYQEAAGC